MLLMLLVCHTTDVSYKTDDSTLTSLFSLKRGFFSFFFLFFLKNFLLFWPSKLRWKAPLSSVRRFVRSSKSPLAPRERERNRERRYLFTAQRVPLLSRFIRTKERSQNIHQKNTLTHTSQKASCDHTARACVTKTEPPFFVHACPPPPLPPPLPRALVGEFGRARARRRLLRRRRRRFLRRGILLDDRKSKMYLFSALEERRTIGAERMRRAYAEVMVVVLGVARRLALFWCGRSFRTTKSNSSSNGRMRRVHSTNSWQRSARKRSRREGKKIIIIIAAARRLRVKNPRLNSRAGSCTCGISSRRKILRRLNARAMR